MWEGFEEGIHLAYSKSSLKARTEGISKEVGVVCSERHQVKQPE